MKKQTRLQKLMEASDEDLDSIKGIIDEKIGDDSDKLGLGKARTSKAIQRIIKTKKFIKIEYMWNGNDLVWHIAPHPKKPWKVDGSRVVLTVAQIMNRSLLNHKVDIWRPVPNMVPEYSFRAYDIRKNWALDEDEIYKAMEELLTELNNLV